MEKVKFTTDGKKYKTLFAYNGKEYKSLSDLAEANGVNHFAISQLMKKGNTLEEAINIAIENEKRAKENFR